MGSKLQTYFFITVLGLVAVVSFFVFKPFLPALIMAVVGAVVFHPLHTRVLSKMGRYPGSASLLTLVLIVVAILIPLSFLGFKVFGEAEQLYFSLLQGGGRITLSHFYHGLSPEWQTNIYTYFQQGLSWLLNNTGIFFSNVASVFVSLFVFLISLYYFFKDGEKLKKVFLRLSPLPDRDDKSILERLELAINSVVRGSFVIAAIQGMQASFGFMLFGIPNPLLWGVVTALASFVPGLGTSLVVAPAVLYLFFSNGIAPAIGLVTWGVLAIGLIDNLLGPRIVGRGARVHPLVIMLSALGGIALFGPFGAFMGPLTLSLFFALLNIYSRLD